MKETETSLEALYTKEFNHRHLMASLKGPGEVGFRLGLCEWPQNVIHWRWSGTAASTPFRKVRNRDETPEVTHTAAQLKTKEEKSENREQPRWLPPLSNQTQGKDPRRPHFFLQPPTCLQKQLKDGREVASFTDQPSTSHISASHTSGAKFIARIVDACRKSSRYSFRFPDCVL